MESKWYFFPGQSPQNTKVSDRAHALHITTKGWGSITQHLDRKKRLQEAIEKEQAYKRALKEGSQSMTKEWVNSIDNLRLTKEKERKEKLDLKKEDKIQTFYKIKEEQEAIRKQYLEKVKKDLFRATDYPRQLTTALVMSETLYEREKQKEFNKKIVKHDEEVKKKFDDLIVVSDFKHKEEDEAHKKKQLEVSKKIGDILKQQITENEETRKSNNKEHVERETLDRINAAKEEELIKLHESEAKKKKRLQLHTETRKELEANRQRKILLEKEEQEMAKATAFYSEAKTKIECMMKRNEQENKARMIRAREELASKVGYIQESKEEEENARMAKAVAERDADAKAKEQAKREAHAQAVKMRLEDRQQFLTRAAQQNQKDEELQSWEMVNRFKTDEMVREYNEKTKREKWAKVLSYRKDLLQQMADDKKTVQEQKEIERILGHVNFDEQDEMFFNYAKEVMDLAKAKNRTTYPIEKVIDEYKKAHNLVQKARRCRCCNK